MMLMLVLGMDTHRHAKLKQMLPVLELELDHALYAEILQFLDQKTMMMEMQLKKMNVQ